MPQLIIHILRTYILPGKPPLYLGLYGDNFAYFSTDPQVEIEFEKQFGKLTKVDFMGTVTHFLGKRFQWRDFDNEV